MKIPDSKSQWAGSLQQGALSARPSAQKQPLDTGNCWEEAVLCTSSVWVSSQGGGCCGWGRQASLGPEGGMVPPLPEVYVLLLPGPVRRFWYLTREDEVQVDEGRC